MYCNLCCLGCSVAGYLILQRKNQRSKDDIDTTNLLFFLILLKWFLQILCIISVGRNKMQAKVRVVIMVLILEIYHPVKTESRWIIDKLIYFLWRIEGREMVAEMLQQRRKSSDAARSFLSTKKNRFNAWWTSAVEATSIFKIVNIDIHRARIVASLQALLIASHLTSKRAYLPCEKIRARPQL